MTEVDPRIKRAYAAGMTLQRAGYRLERTDHSDTKPTGFQILRGRKVISGAKFDLMIEDVERFIASVGLGPVTSK